MPCIQVDKFIKFVNILGYCLEHQATFPPSFSILCVGCLCYLVKYHKYVEISKYLTDDVITLVLSLYEEDTGKALMSSGLESDLRDTVEWGNRWLVSFNAGKTQLVSFDRSSNSGVIDIKMDKAVLEEKSSIPFVRSVIYF